MKKNNLIIAATLIAIFLVSTSWANNVHAQTASTSNATNSLAGSNEYLPAANPQYTLLEPLPCLAGDTTQTCTNGQVTKVSIQTYVIYVFKLAIALAVFLAVVMVTFAGFKYMTEESITEKGAAKEMIQNAIFGLLGALGSYLILYTINPQFVNLSLISVHPLNLKVNPNVIDRGAFNNQINAGTQQSINSAIDQNAAAVSAQQTAQGTIQADGQNLFTDGCIDEAGNDISDPSDKTCANDGIASYDSAQSVLVTAVAAQTTQKAVVSMNTAETTFNSNTLVHQISFVPLTGGSVVTVGNTSPADLATALSNADSIYSSTLSQLPNTDVADKDAIGYQKTYTEASTINDYNTNVLVNNLANDINSNLQSTSLTPVITQDIANAQAQITALQNSVVPHQYTTTTVSTGGAQTQTIDVVGLGNLNSSPTLLAQYQQNNAIRIQALQSAIQTAQAKLPKTKN